MKKNFLLFILLLSGFILQAQSTVRGEKIIISKDIWLVKYSDKAYMHVSVANMGKFGKVASNGLVLIDNGEAFLFDTPVSNEQTETLESFIHDSLKAKITMFVAGHWHDDCMGGLDYIHSIGAESYANAMTIDIAVEKGLPVPKNGFKKSLPLKWHGIDISCYYPGAGHSTDNIVVWIPNEQILFGGCLVKDLGSNGLGNVADGDVKAWPKSISKVLKKFPDAKIVIPGHGKAGDTDLLHHTYNVVSKSE